MKISFKLLFLLLIQIFNSLSAQSVNQGKYWVLSGSIHTYPITMIIAEENGNLSGQYYYNKVQVPIWFNGSINNGVWNLKIDNDSMIEEFNLQETKIGLKGVWIGHNKQLETNLTNVLPWEWISVNYDKQFSDFKDSLEGGINISSRMLWTDDNGILDKEVRSIQFDLLENQKGENTDEEEFNNRVDWVNDPQKEQLVKLLTKDLKAPFDDYCQMVKDELAGGELFYSGLSQNSDVSISYYSENYIVFTTSYSEYTGGAHGLYGNRHFTFDLKKKKWASIYDRLSPKQIEKAPELLEKHFREQYTIPEGDKLSEWLFIESFEGYNLENVYMTDNGVTSYFGLYEIGPYAIGMIEIFIPWEDFN